MSSSILLISYYYLPYNTPASYRMAGFARSLEKAGYDVYCLTSNTYKEHKDLGLASRLGSRARVIQTPAWELKRRVDDLGGDNLLRRLWNSLADRVEKMLLPLDPAILWVIPAWLKARKVMKENQIGIVLISSPPHSSQLIGLLLQRNSKTMLITDFRDSWSHNPVHLSKRKLSRWMKVQTENRVLRRSDLIIANTWSNNEMLERDFNFVKGKTEIILNGFFEQDGISEPKKRGTSSVFRLVYAGELYPGYVDNIFSAIRNMKEKYPNLSAFFQFEVAGLIDESDWSRIEEFGITDVIRYHGFLSYDDSLALVRNADAVLLVMPNHFKNVVGSKLYTYLGQRCVILALIPDGDAAHIIRDVNAGVVIVENFVQEATNVLSEWVFSNNALDYRYREDRLARYTREFQGENLVKCLSPRSVKTDTTLTPTTKRPSPIRRGDQDGAI